MPLVVELFDAEYEVRRYRAKGDAAYEDGRSRSSTEFHGLASQAARKAATAIAQLTVVLGPDGGPGVPVAGVLALAREQAAALAKVGAGEAGSFEDACFYMRHPRWAGLSERFREAQRKWFDSPALVALAPGYQVIWGAWVS